MGITFEEKKEKKKEYRVYQIVHLGKNVMVVVVGSNNFLNFTGTLPHLSVPAPR